MVSYYLVTSSESERNTGSFMKTATNKFSLAIVKKIVMSVTGLLMCVFLVTHLAGNLLMLLGKDEFNNYSHFLISLPIIVPAIEIALIVILLIHIVEAVLLWQQNRAARPIAYEGGKTWATSKSEKSKKNLSSTLMMWSGIIILIFIVLHVWMFKYGPYYSYSPGGGTSFVQAPAGSGLQSAGANLQVVPQPQIRDLYRLVVENFKNPLIAILYMLAMVVLGGHLYHAVWSSSQTLGATNNNWRRIMLWLGKAFAIVIAVGFFILPLWVYFFVNWTPQ